MLGLKRVQRDAEVMYELVRRTRELAFESLQRGAQDDFGRSIIRRGVESSDTVANARNVMPCCRQSLQPQAYRRASRTVRRGEVLEMWSAVLYCCEKAAAPKMSSGSFRGPMALYLYHQAEMMGWVLNGSSRELDRAWAHPPHCLVYPAEVAR